MRISIGPQTRKEDLKYSERSHCTGGSAMGRDRGKLARRKVLNTQKLK